MLVKGNPRIKASPNPLMMESMIVTTDPIPSRVLDLIMSRRKNTMQVKELMMAKVRGINSKSSVIARVTSSGIDRMV